METESYMIRDMAVCERPGTRLDRLGAEALRDPELLAVALRLPSVQAAETLLARHPLAEWLSMDLRTLKSQRALSSNRAHVLVATRELVRRGESNRRSDVPVINSMSDIVGQSVDLRSRKKEHLLAFFLNARQQLIAKEIISIGTLTASLAHPREIFAPAIGKAAASVILVHNHPSGDPSPSEEDLRLTKRISQAGHIMGIELQDHIIVAENGCYSFKQAGAL